MSVEEIRAFQKAQPFQPFELVTADGRSVRVGQAERIGIAPWGRIVVFDQGLPTLLLVSEVATAKPLPSAA